MPIGTGWPCQVAAQKNTVVVIGSFGGVLVGDCVLGVLGYFLGFFEE